MKDIKSFASEDISTFLLKTLTENRNSKSSSSAYKTLNDKNLTLEDLFNGEDNNDIFKVGALWNPHVAKPNGVKLGRKRQYDERIS